MTTESNLGAHLREMAEAQAQLRAETAKAPQFAAMAKAMQPTKDEQAMIDAAEANVREAEHAVNGAGLALDRARRGLEPVREQAGDKPFGFILKRRDTHRAAKAAEPGLRADLEEAQIALTFARRRLNAMVRDVERARMERRRAARLKFAPKREQPKSQGDRWSTLGPKAAA